MGKKKPVGALEDGTLLESVAPPEFVRELLLETVKNSEHITPEIQRTVARFVDVCTAPRIVLANTIDTDLFKGIKR